MNKLPGNETNICRVADEILLSTGDLDDVSLTRVLSRVTGRRNDVSTLLDRWRHSRQSVRSTVPAIVVSKFDDLIKDIWLLLQVSKGLGIRPVNSSTVRTTSRSGTSERGKPLFSQRLKHDQKPSDQFTDEPRQDHEDATLPSPPEPPTHPVGKNKKSANPGSAGFRLLAHSEKAANPEMAEAAARVLWEHGGPMKPTALATAVALRLNWRLKRPVEQIKGVLEGSSIVDSGNGSYWFSNLESGATGETKSSSAKRRGMELFKEVKRMLQNSRFPMHISEIRKQLGEPADSLGPDWLKHCFVVEVKKPNSNIERVAPSTFIWRDHR